MEVEDQLDFSTTGTEEISPAGIVIVTNLPMAKKIPNYDFEACDKSSAINEGIDSYCKQHLILLSLQQTCETFQKAKKIIQLNSITSASSGSTPKL